MRAPSRRVRLPGRARWRYVPGLALLLVLGARASARGGEIPWRPGYEQARAEAQARNMPVWVQFTGPWCIFCRKMERETFANPSVVAMGTEAYIPVKVRTDEREDVAAQFGISSLPATVLMDAEGRILARTEGFADAGQFLGLLQQSRPAPELALGGKCPVSLVQGKGLVDGRPELALLYDNRAYRFATEEARDLFLEDPEPYLPANGGRCVVRQVEDHEQVAGDPSFGVYYRKHLYLCADQAARERFAEDPEKFANVDLGGDGYCPHCRAAGGQLVRGKPQYSATRSGRRYLFPDALHLEAFRANPFKYLR